MTKYLTSNEAGSILGVTGRAVRYWIHDGAHELGKHFRERGGVWTVAKSYVDRYKAKRGAVR